MPISIRVLRGTTSALLTPEQINLVKPTLDAMLLGKISLALANEIVIEKLADAGKPLNFGDGHAASS